jgi:SAM-dependent methyltransferase
MVFDICFQNSITERHLTIHSLHQYGQSNIPIINNLDEMIKCINDERKKLNDFLKLPYDNYRWYPKPAWRIINIKDFIIPFIDIINMKNDIDKWICNENGLVHYDGLILTPLMNNNYNNNLREIKIKPKKYYTIDLLYKNNKWLDRDNFEWDITCDEDIELSDGIWRCYPINNKYVAKEIRMDKTKPNTFNIISTIMELYNIEYKYSYPMIYHEIKSSSNKTWSSVIDSNKIIMEKMINKVNKLKSNGNILDCGCGYGRTLKYLNNFNNYIGLDIDINLIGQSINKYSYDKKIIFNYCDLNKIDKSLILRNNYYDIVLIINSIMHFSTDVFWKKINNITKSKSILLLNILDINNNTKYTFDNSYFIERKDDMVYYQFPIHNSIRQEKYIDINEITKYGWKIIETFKPSDENLTKNYIWYILIKN